MVGDVAANDMESYLQPVSSVDSWRLAIDAILSCEKHISNDCRFARWSAITCKKAIRSAEVRMGDVVLGVLIRIVDLGNAVNDMAFTTVQRDCDATLVWLEE